MRAAAHEDMEAAEAQSLRQYVPRMVRHWALGHSLTVNPRAPLWVKAVVAQAARELQDLDPPTVESGGNPAVGVDRPDPTPDPQPHRRLPDPQTE